MWNKFVSEKKFSGKSCLVKNVFCSNFFGEKLFYFVKWFVFVKDVCWSFFFGEFVLWTKRFLGNKVFGVKSFLIINVTSATTVTTFTTVTTVTTVTTATTNTTITAITAINVKYQMLLLYSFTLVKKSFSLVSLKTDQRTDRLTTRLLELLWAAKNCKESLREGFEGTHWKCDTTPPPVWQTFVNIVLFVWIFGNYWNMFCPFLSIFQAKTGEYFQGVCDQFLESATELPKMVELLTKSFEHQKIF